MTSGLNLKTQWVERCKMKIQSKTIEMIDINLIVENPKNANRHSLEQIDRLEKLINFQGFRNPLVISKRSGFLIAGHGRLEAAKNIGMTELPVIHQDFESEAQEYAYLVSDNEIARWAELDRQSVYDELKTIDIPKIELLGIEHFDKVASVELDPIDEPDLGNVEGEKMVECPGCGEVFNPKKK